MFSPTTPRIDAPQIATIETLEDRLCFSTTATITLSAHQRHLQHVAHLGVQRQIHNGIFIQVNTIQNTPSNRTDNAGNVNSSMLSGNAISSTLKTSPFRPPISTPPSETFAPSAASIRSPAWAALARRSSAVPALSSSPSE
jgi:hypothetical protein